VHTRNRVAASLEIRPLGHAAIAVTRVNLALPRWPIFGNARYAGTFFGSLPVTKAGGRLHDGSALSADAAALIRR